MSKTLNTFLRFIAVVVGVVAAIGMALIGVLMIFGSFFFDEKPTLLVAFQHLAIFGVGVIFLAAALTLGKSGIDFLFKGR